jgi:hypothetical protein
MEKRKLKIDVIDLVKIAMSLPVPYKYDGNKYVVGVNINGVLSIITFVKDKNKWKLLMNSNVIDENKIDSTDKLWIDECTHIDELKLNLIMRKNKK